MDYQDINQPDQDNLQSNRNYLLQQESSRIFGNQQELEEFMKVENLLASTISN